MYLSNVIKNFIVVGLLILILHFMIRNLLKETFPMEAPLSVDGLPPSPIDDNEVNVADSSKKNKNETTRAATNKDNKQKEHFNPDEHHGDADEIELFQWAYSPAPVTDEPRKTSPTLPEKDVPASSSTPLNSQRQKNARTPAEQHLKSAVVINEYDHEDPMNGGALFAGLRGYEGGQSQWSLIGDSSSPLLPQVQAK